MTFEEILDQAIAMLQRRGRVTYRTLRLQFQLDEEKLEALKEALLDAERLAIDEEGRVLVWTGPPASPPTASASRGALQDHPPGQPPPLAEVGTTAAGQVPRPSDAERRQLTVMFCDLVDSTTLSSQLDPEDYRDMVRAYQRVCAEDITRFDGHIAQLLGDGLLVYFGYPQAHEDDAQRAVRTGLSILDAMRDLNQRLQQTKGIQLGVHIGIHTGLVVVGEMGGQGRQEQLALGEVPNVCARIQGLAAPNTIAISEATYRLVQGYFTCEALGAQTLRGVAEPIHVYRVLQDSGARGRLDVAVTRGLTPLVGRESEVALLLERWAQVKDGQGHVVLLTGDPGIGKSRLVQMLKEHVAHEPHTRWECRSSEYYQNTALFPLTDLFQRLLQFHPEDTPDEKLGKLEQTLSQYRLPLEESIQLFAPLFSLPLPEDRYPPLNVSPQRQRQKTLETLVAILLELAERQPVLLIIEDLHWTDPSTLELLNLVVEQTPTASLLTLLTCRPTFQPSWTHRSYLTEVSVTRLAQPQVARMVARIAGGAALPHEVMQQIGARTDGVPLFVEEITKAILESGQLKVVDAHYELTGSLSTLAIPTTLQDSLMARLDRLVTAKAVAQYAAVIGRQFSYELLQVVSQVDEAMLQHELGRLVEAEIVYQRGVPPQATYVFKHALIRDAAYESLLKSTRQQYHQHIAQVLEAQFPETAETQPELVAHYYTEAGITEKAVYYWHHAGQRASERSAHVEAIAHLRQGLALLQTLLETPERLQHEADLLITLGASLRATQGSAAPEVGQTYTRARQLCQHLEDPQRLIPVLRGFWNHYLVRADLRTAHALGAQLFDLAQQSQDAAMRVAAHRALGATLFYLGETALAYTHLVQGMALYDPKQHRASAFLHGEDAGVICHILAAWALWCLGFPDQGLARSDAAVTLVQQSAHPFSLGFVLNAATICYQFRHEARCTQDRAEAAIRLATEQGFPYWRARGAMLRGWALAHQGQAQEGIEQITQGLRAHRATGAELLRSYFLALLAEAHGTMGQPEAGLTALAEALTLADTTSERWYEPELYRLKGELLLQQNSDNQTEAESAFHQALAIAQSQSAKSWELRASTSLARLWQQQGKRQEAHDLLAPIYNWFTEGFDTLDLMDAKALLEALA
jgi:class 3 adenylate cyclase/predicted ATPase/energy-coupling factor transporter ATP-binding protein EcfA2